MAQKTIVFIRHAKSSWTDLSMRDYDRPLDSRGLSDAPIMARKLMELGIKPDLIVSSGAKRAQETAAFFSKEADLPYVIEENLYHAPPSSYMSVVNSLAEKINTVCLVGHNPGMTDIANLVKEGSTDDLSTCGIVIASVEGDKSWEEVDWTDTRLIKILTPKQSK